MSVVMAHSAADVVRTVLVLLGGGENPPSVTWPIFVGNEPPTPDNSITLYDTEGVDSGRSMIDGELWGYYGIQLRVRSTDHVTGAARANLLRRYLAEYVSYYTVTISSHSYLIHSISNIGRALSLGKESPTSKRHLFTVNALVSVRAIT